MKIFYGAKYNLEVLIKTHLFLIIPNNSGSTFLKNALATSSKTWNLVKEGQHTYGFVGPNTIESPSSLLWSARSEWVDNYSDEKLFNWEKTRKMWYFQSFSKNPNASIFVEKTPPSVLRVSQLQDNFRNAKFIFMVRNPYAVIEGIYRREKNKIGKKSLDLAAKHMINCFTYQLKNIEQFKENGIFFRYEDMCENPELIQQKINALTPELDDLILRQKIPNKMIYDEMLRNMNDQQLANLTKKDFQVINNTFHKNESLLHRFGYSLIEK